MPRLRPVSVLVACFLVAAGCVGIGPPLATDEWSQQGTIVDVVDGDTVDVRFDGGGGDTVRLLGVDSPELGGGNEPGEFEGVSDSEEGRRCLTGAARDAASFAERHLAGATVDVVVDEGADRRDRYGRLLAYVVLPNGTDFNRLLVETGNARVYDSTFSRDGEYAAAESRARAENRGLWRCREPRTAGVIGETALRIVSLHADAAGDDHENRNDEYVVFRNGGESAIDLTGWTVRDEGGRVYAFPDGLAVEPGGTVTLYSGAGTDSDDTLYWDADGAIWNNGGDTVLVMNGSGTTVLRYRY